MLNTGSDSAEPTQEELRRLVNSVIWPGFHGTTLPSWLRKVLGEGLAGVVYFSQNIDPDSPGQIAKLSAEVRAAHPLAVIGVDEEGGGVSRLQAKRGSLVPGAALLGRLDDVELSEAAGRTLGRLCREAGINLNLAPVADVNTNPLNPVIGVRSFGADTALVGRHTVAVLRGIQALGVGACVKHFPGHGDTVTDSHLGLPRLDLKPEVLKAQHLPPFQQAIEAGVQAVMTAHIVVPGLGDPAQSETPATLNPAAGELLRSLGFRGLQITDALDMGAIRATVGSGLGAVQALLAGADLLCLGNPANAGSKSEEAEYLEVFDAVLAAAQNGQLPREVLETASGRVMAFARWSTQAMEAAADTRGGAVEQDWAARIVNAFSLSEPPSEPGEISRTTNELEELAKKLAWPTGTELHFLDARRGHNMAAGPSGNFFAAALSEHYQLRRSSLDQLSSTPGAVVVLADALQPGSEQLEALTQLAKKAPKAICINAGMAPGVQLPLSTVNCFDSSRITARAVAALLSGSVPGR
ncbi:beta-N-acetylhexosaminidase [Psychromicrobium silvestre]|uniref:Beta-N-acetylhexosaminidase n=1 Tax=Psychromicrobium silvestre TaxID=1645614 RepID=A0A7Y9LVL1_9MICC|nr:glycoside hydrolase family 3 N-terminal domain-containing protein [Psychromicrobium silvestre]NYE96430.1 beta-N-acetylhexosaminidase [Psychromicrobium silvestre]